MSVEDYMYHTSLLPIWVFHQEKEALEALLFSPSWLLRRYSVSRYETYLSIFKISHLELSGIRKGKIVFADVEKGFMAGNHHLISCADFLNKCFLSMINQMSWH